MGRKAQKLFLFTLLVALSPLATQAERVYGDFKAIVDEVHDGDTVFVNIPGLPAFAGEHVGIRVLGVDCPELHDPDAAIAAYSARIRDWVKKQIKPGDTVELVSLRRDKYGGRYVADIRYGDGKQLAHELLKHGFAKVYDGGTKDPWKRSEVPK